MAADRPSPRDVIAAGLEEWLALSTESVADAIINLLSNEGWHFVSDGDLQRMVDAEAELELLKAGWKVDPVKRPDPRPGWPLYPGFMQTLITYIGALDGAVKAIVEREGESPDTESPYLGEIPVLYYGEQIGVITDEDGIGHSFRFTPPAEEDAS